MKNIISIIVTIISIATFVFIVKPQYVEIQNMKVQDTELEDVLDNARKLQSVRDQLLEKRKDISASDVRRLEKLIPESADNVKLILEFEQIADRYNLSIDAASASKEDVETGEKIQNFDIETKDYGIITLDFSLGGSYPDLIAFLKDIEKNLRITDIRSLSISPPGDLSGNYGFSLTVDTYWLKDNI